MPNILIQDLIRRLIEIQDGALWFDQSFKDKFDSLAEAEAFHKPTAAIHSVAEHVSHMLEWRKECILRYNLLKTELMNSPDDWKDEAVLRKIGWVNLKDALYTSTGDLINLIAGKDDSYLQTKFQDTDYNFLYLMEGIIHHDIYHLGQIGITLKLMKETKIN